MSEILLLAFAEPGNWDKCIWSNDKVAPLVDLLSVKSPAKPASTYMTILHSGGSPTKHVWTHSLVCSRYEINLWSLRSHATFHLVTFRARSFTVHSRSGLPTLAKYKTYSTDFDAMVVSFPVVTKTSGANRWSSMQGVVTCFSVVRSTFPSSRYLNTHCSAWPLISYW